MDERDLAEKARKARSLKKRMREAESVAHNFADHQGGIFNEVQDEINDLHVEVYQLGVDCGIFTAAHAEPNQKKHAEEADEVTEENALGAGGVAVADDAAGAAGAGGGDGDDFEFGADGLTTRDEAALTLKNLVKAQFAINHARATLEAALQGDDEELIKSMTASAKDLLKKA